VIVALAAGATAARAYPVGGTYTYENASEHGPAKSCGGRTMTFAGNLRRDTGSGAPEYKNISTTQSGVGRWRVLDEFYTGMQWGRVSYTLQVIDNDHIRLRFDAGGGTTLLRRCE